MKKALKITGTAILSLSMFMFVSTFTSCSTEGCTDDTATNYDEKADEDDGSCTYERDAFIGKYNNATDGCIPGESFNMEITAGAGATNLIAIKNFAGFGDAIIINATVTGASFTVQPGSLGNGQSLLSGNGSISGTQLTLSYTFEVDGSTFTCTVNGTRS